LLSSARCTTASSQVCSRPPLSAPIAPRWTWLRWVCWFRSHNALCLESGQLLVMPLPPESPCRPQTAAVSVSRVLCLVLQRRLGSNQPSHRPGSAAALCPGKLTSTSLLTSLAQTRSPDPCCTSPTAGGTPLATSPMWSVSELETLTMHLDDKSKARLGGCAACMVSAAHFP
jgi:hypothetical protein